MSVPPPKRQKTMPAPGIVVDVSNNSEGDLVLAVGDGDKAMLLRVHSSFLKMASPVFRAMLGVNFVEGSTTYTADNPLDLKEDKAQAMLDLCSLIQHQYRNEDSLPLTRIRDLVVVADKYQCVELVRSWFVSAIAQYFTSSVDEKSPAFDELELGLGNAMCMAYAVRDSQLFWRISRTAIVQRDASKIKVAIKKGLCDLMPNSFFENIRKLQVHERDRLIQRLFKAEALVLSTTSRASVGVPMCNRLRHLIGEYNHCLWKRDLKQAERTTPGTGLQVDYGNIRQIAKDCDPSNASVQGIKCSKHCRSCPTQKFKSDVLDSVKVSLRSCKGMCLECVRTQSEADAGEKCSHKFNT